MARTLARHDADLAQLRRLLDLLAGELGVDLDRVELLDRVERTGWPVRWEELEALGIDPTGELHR